MKTVDYPALKSALKEISAKTYGGYIKKQGARDVCGFALYSDEDAMSVGMAINTCQHYKDNVREDPENRLYYKFNPEEWAEIVENDELDTFNRCLQAIYFKIRKKEAAEYRRSIFKMCAEILGELKNENIFSESESGSVLLFSISDGDLPEFIKEYNRQYNSRETVREYEQWLLEEDEYEEEEEGDDS